MQTKLEKFKESLLWGLQWKNYKVLLIANTLIAIFLSIFSFSPEPKIWFKSIAHHFILAQCIGRLNYLQLFYTTK